MTGEDVRSELPPIDVSARVDRLRSELNTREVEAFIASSTTSRRWLTGFTGSAGLVVVTADDLVLVTDARYAEQAPEELAAASCTGRFEITSYEQPAAVQAAVGDATTVGLEADHMSWAQATTIDTEWLSDGARAVATSGVVTGLRAIKDAAETARITAAARITDLALTSVRDQLVAGTTEREFARLLEAEIRALGAEDIAFDTIVASGPNGARPHHRPGDRPFESGDLVIVDVGARVDGYRSDMTRTFGIGPVSDERQDMYDVVIAAQQAGVDAVRDGVAAKDIDTACREVIEAAGRGDHFVHGTGHGVGLDIHELPRIGSSVDDRIVSGQVITVEPGVYDPAIGGVRIEDCVLVGGDGGTRLTRSPKSLDPDALVAS